MKCEICGEKYVYSCMHCTKRIMTWGYDGYMKLKEMAKNPEDIMAMEMFEIALQYYKGKAKERGAISNVIRRALKALGYKGKIIGRIHKNGMTYLQIRRREHETGRRYRLRNDTCDRCGGVDQIMLHHIVPLSWGGKSTPENCITLCKGCHEKTHKKLTKYLNRSKLLEYLKPYYEEIEMLSKQSILPAE